MLKIFYILQHLYLYLAITNRLQLIRPWSQICPIFKSDSKFLFYNNIWSPGNLRWV